MSERVSLISEVFAREDWMDQAACAYDNAPTSKDDQPCPKEDHSENCLCKGTGQVSGYEAHAWRMDRLFFSPRDDRGTSGEESAALLDAVAMCLDCPVRRDCLRYALDMESDPQSQGDPEGVYGGMTQWERRAILRAPLADLDEPEAGKTLLMRLSDAKAEGENWDESWPSLSTRLDRLGVHLSVVNRCEDGPTSPEVAKQLGLTVQTVTNLAMSGVLVAVKFGNRYRFDPAGVAAYAESRIEARASTVCARGHPRRAPGLRCLVCKRNADLRYRQRTA